MLYAHRVSWELHYGPIPAGRQVLHHCDTTQCVRPAHLFLGTQADNVADMIRKGRRGRTGPRAGVGAKSPFTPEQVREIFRDAEIMTQIQIAAKYGVGQSTISRLLRGETCTNIGS